MEGALTIGINVMASNVFCFGIHPVVQSFWNHKIMIKGIHMAIYMFKKKGDREGLPKAAQY